MELLPGVQYLRLTWSRSPEGKWQDRHAAAQQMTAPMSGERSG